MEIKKTEHGVYHYEGGLQIAFTNEIDTWIVRGTHVSKEQYNKEFAIQEEVKQTSKKNKK